ncbi:MAG: lysophospholipid acyltransferase family protein [Pseudomonadota bacterium]
MLENLRASGVLALIVVVTVPLIPVQFLANRFNWQLKRNLPVFWHRMASRLVGLKVTVKGHMADDRPLLIVANHVSWLDILAFSTVGSVSFVAKREVRTWPGVGLLAALQRTVFVDRERRTKTAGSAREISARLETGDVLVLFAEGTSSDGGRVLPFRTALFGALPANSKSRGEELRGMKDTDVQVQPVAIAYTHLQGIVVGTPDRAIMGFYGDMDMAPHLWSVIRKGGVDATIAFGTPYAAQSFENRKDLAQALHQDVRVLRREAIGSTAV